MKLKDYLYFEKTSITDFAKTVGVSRAHLSGVANGFRNASLSLIIKLQKFSNGKVTENDFDEEGKTL